MECVDYEVGCGGSDMTFHVTLHRFVIYHNVVISSGESSQLICLHRQLHIKVSRSTFKRTKLQMSMCAWPNFYSTPLPCVPYPPSLKYIVLNNAWSSSPPLDHLLKLTQNHISNETIIFFTPVKVKPPEPTFLASQSCQFQKYPSPSDVIQ